MRDNKIRLLFVIPSISAYIDRVCALVHLQRKVDKFVLLTVYDESEWQKQFKHVIFYAIRNSRSVRSLYSQAADAAEFICKKEAINICHDTFGLLSSYYKKKPEGVIKVSSIYNFAVWDFYEYHRKRYSIIRMLLNRNLRQCLYRMPVERKAIKNADYIVIQSEALKEKLKKYHIVDDHKIRVVPNSIEISFMKEQKALKRTDSELKLLFIGGFSVAKGAVTLINLATLAARHKKKLTITAVGGIDSADKKLLLGRIKKLRLESFFEFIPKINRNELTKLYRQSVFLLHFSLLEGSPRVVLESLAYGLPVIVNDLPGIRCFDEKSEFIKYYQSDDDTFNYIEKVSNDREKWNSLSFKGREHIINNFSSENISSLYLQNYLDFLSNK